MFTTITPPAVPPVSLEDVKTQLALTLDQYDALITALIGTATEMAERELNSSIIDTEKEFYASGLCPDSLSPFVLGSFGSIRIPHGHIHTVSKVEYRTCDGIWHDLDSTVWDWTSHFGQCLLFPKPNTSFPSVALYPVFPLRVSFISGFGSDSDAVPDAVKHAIRMTACYLFERRDDAPAALPQAAMYLLANHRCVTQEMF